VHADPVHADPVDAELVDTEPAGAEPIEAEPAEAEPVEAEPVEAEPGPAESLHAEPVDADVVDAEILEPDLAGTASAETGAEPVDAEIIDAEIIESATAPEPSADITTDPADAEPVHADPADAEPADADPVETEPVHTDATNAEPGDADPADAEPVDADPTNAEPADADPAEAEPVDLHPAESAAPEAAAEPAPTEPVEAEHPEPEPLHADPATTAQPESAQPETPEAATPEAAPHAGSAAHPRTGLGALRTPSMQLPTPSVPPPPQPGLEPERRRADPEQVLAAYPWKFDPVTLRETVEDPEPLLAIRDRLTDKLEYAERDTVRARLLSLRAVVSRVLGEFGRALADAQEALRHAEATGELRRTAIVQARLAHVQQWRGDFAEADRLFEEANSVELPDRLRAEMHVHAGKSAYEQGRYLEACNHFEAALALRRVADPELITRTETALDAVMTRVRETGWGPYPRSREEILQQSRPPHPALDYESGWQGYADSDGEVVIPERYAEAQPFHEGVAWVRRPGTAAWELIDETGALVIDAASGYVQVGRFADGLAWVSREPAGGLFAIDWHNRVIVPGGFEEARPFRHGLAVVRRGGWGAIDRHGRVVVQLKYQRFATELTAGGPVEGFTGDGLAVIDAGDRLGVVDRTGQLLVAPVHARLLIHPVAFVVGDRDGRWGALDRNGDPIVEVTRARPGDVVDEIEKLLSDIRPVL
jgi:tetratricopeptide (TPR) repeat protein